MPQINGFSPMSGPVDTMVILDVGGLASLPGDVSVWFGGDVEADAPRTLPTGPNSMGVQVSVPQGAATGPIHVVWREAQLVDLSTPAAFQVTAAPVPGGSDPSVTGWRPRQPAPGVAVIMTGSNLLHVRTLIFRGGETNFSVTAFRYLHDADMCFAVPQTATSGKYRLNIATQTGGSVPVPGVFTIGG